MAPVRLAYPRDDDVALGWYASFAARHLRLIAPAVLIGLLLGGAVGAHRGRVYTATVEIIASKAPLGIAPQALTLSGLPVNPPTVDTEAQLLESDLVLGPAARRLADGRSAADLRRAIGVTVPVGTRALVLRYDARSSAAASRGATEIAREYLAVRFRLNGEQRSRELIRLHVALHGLLQEQRATRDSPLAEGLERQSIRQVATAVATLHTAPAQPAELAESPSVEASRPNLSVLLATGALLGLLSGVALALVLEERRKGMASNTDYGYPRPDWTRVAGTHGEGL